MGIVPVEEEGENRSLSSFTLLRTCQVGGYLQVREDLKVLRTQISGG